MPSHRRLPLVELLPCIIAYVGVKCVASAIYEPAGFLIIYRCVRRWRCHVLLATHDAHERAHVCVVIILRGQVQRASVARRPDEWYLGEEKQAASCAVGVARI